jgi:hypothetical protein
MGARVGLPDDADRDHHTFSVGVVRDAIAAVSGDPDTWSLPVVGETYDGFLNDIRAQRVTAEHVNAAFASASGEPVEEGNVGGGTGMICHGFKVGSARPRARSAAMSSVCSCRRTTAAATAFGRRRPRRGADRRPHSRAQTRRRDGLDHRHRRDRCAAPATPVRPPGAACRPRCRSDGRDGRALKRRSATATPFTRSIRSCFRECSGDPEPAPLKRARTEGTPLVFAEIVDGRPPDVSAFRTLRGIRLPQR